MSDTLPFRDKTNQFPNAAIREWKDIPPGDGARLIPSLTTVAKVSSSDWQLPRGQSGCVVPSISINALANSQLLGVVIRTDQMLDGVLPGGLLMIAPNTEVEHVVWHGERSTLTEARSFGGGSVRPERLPQ